MDFLAHAAYGATLCSRTGLAGGRRGAGVGARRDWTVWAAAGISLLPDVTSMGVGFTHRLLQGGTPSWHDIPPYVFELYNVTHSLVIAAVVLAVIRFAVRPLFVPALAWPLHVLLDAVSHGDGRWESPMLFPLSDWHPPGIDWWRHPSVMLTYWAILPLTWLAIHLWRRTGRQNNDAPRR